MAKSTINTNLSDFRSFLLDLLLKDAKVSGLLNAGYETLGNPMILFNHRGEVLSISQHEPYHNPEWEEAEQSCFYGKKEFTKLISNDFECENPHIFQTGVANQRAMIALLPGIYSKTYIMMLESEKAFQEKDDTLLYALASAVAIKLRKRKKSNTLWIDTHELFISNLLLGRIQEEIVARKYAKNFGIWVVDDMVLLTARSAIKLGESDLAALSPELAEIFPGCKTSVFNGDLIILLFDVSTVSYNSKQLVKARTFFKKQQLQACVSSPFRKMNTLRYHYKYATSTLQVCANLHIEDEIVFYDQFILDNRFSNYEEKDLKMMCHPGVMQLYQMDKAEGTSNILHLYAYVLMWGNRSDASRILNITTNTFKYRMKDMEKTLGDNYIQSLPILYVSIKILFTLFPYDMEDCRQLESISEDLRK